MKTILTIAGGVKELKETPSSKCRHRGAEKNMVAVRCCGGALRNHRSYECAVHGRCLPTYQPTGKSQEAWLQRLPESALYKLCSGCENFETAPHPATIGRSWTSKH